MSGKVVEVVFGPDPSALWLAWEAQAPKIEADQRSEVEVLSGIILAKTGRRRSRKRKPEPTPELIESVLAKSAACQLEDPRRAKHVAELAGDSAAHLLFNPAADVYSARSCYLAGNASRLLGDPGGAEIALAGGFYFLSSCPDSLDRAFYCRSLALVRWELGRLDEARALLSYALERFWLGRPGRKKRADEERGTTGALLGLLELELGQEDAAKVALRAALDAMDLKRRPWLTVRATLAHALVLAGNAPDLALAVLQEVWRLAPQITESREKDCIRWWEGRVQARLGNPGDAIALLGSARRTYLDQRLVAEAALISLDGMAALAEAGRRTEAFSWAEELLRALEGKRGAEVAFAAVWALQVDIQSERGDLRARAVAHATSLARAGVTTWDGLWARSVGEIPGIGSQGVEDIKRFLKRLEVD